MSAVDVAGAAAGGTVPRPDRIRDAATVILIDRDRAGGPAVLMGMRGAAAVADSVSVVSFRSQ